MEDAKPKSNKLELANARAKKYYEAHKDEIARKRKEDRLKAKNPPTIPAKTTEQALEELKEAETPVPAYQTIRQLLHLIDNKDVNTAFNNADRIIHLLENANTLQNPEKKYSTNSKKTFYQAILNLIDTLKINIPETERAKYFAQHHLYKVKSSMETQEKKNDEVMDFNIYLRLVKDTFDDDSKEFIIASLYKLYGFRDNLQLKIISKETKETREDKSTNYIIVPPYKHWARRGCTIILNVYKTDARYKQDILPITRSISTAIRKYIGMEGLEPGDYLFGNKSLSHWIVAFNKKLGLDIGINTLRHMKVAYEFSKKEMTAEERVKLAKDMKHAPATTENYLRKITNPEGFVLTFD
jgi:hypothetical protein